MVRRFNLNKYWFKLGEIWFNINLILNGDFVLLYWENERENVDMLDYIYIGCRGKEGYEI